MRQGIWAGLAGSSVLVLGVLAAPAAGNTSIDAAPSDPAARVAPVAIAAAKDCAKSEICVWNKRGYKGEMSSTKKATPCVAGKTRSSINNNRKLTIVLYDNKKCRGEGFGKLAPGTDVASFKTPSGKKFASAVKIKIL